MRARKTDLHHLGALLRIVCIFAVLLSAGCGDRGGGHLLFGGPGGAGPDSTPPVVLSVSPSDNDTGVPINAVVSVSFSKSIAPATVTNSTVTLYETGNAPVTVSLLVSDSTLAITPTSSLKVRTTYTVCISSSVTDLAGNHLPANKCWTFSTKINSGIFKPNTTIRTGSSPLAVAIGDVTGDGKNDVLLGTSDSHVILLAQDDQGGLATAATYTTTSSPSSMAIGDVNNDGKKEIVVGYGSGKIEILSYAGTGNLISLGTYSSIDTLFIRIADLNGDGLLDVVGIGWGTDTAAVFLQNANGTLAPPVTYAVKHGGWDDLEVGDVNNDGLADIVAMSGQGFSPNIGVLTQRSDGTFDPAVYYDLGGNELTEGVAVGDVNGDALKDIVVTYQDYSSNYSHRIAVFPQNSAGTLSSATSYTTYYNPDPVDIADVNNDGRQDIIVLHNSTNNAGIYLQSADGTLGPEELYGLPYASDYSAHGFSVGDINNDGYNDIIIAGYNNLVILYHK